MIETFIAIGEWWIAAVLAGTTLLIFALILRALMQNPAPRIAIGWILTTGLVSLSVWSMWPGRPLLYRPLTSAQLKANSIVGAESAMPHFSDNHGDDTRVFSTRAVNYPLSIESITYLNSVWPWAAWIGLAFFVYVVLYLGFCLFGSIRLARIVSQSYSADETIYQLFRSSEHQASLKVKLLISDMLFTPAATGCLSPIILLPKSMVKSRSAELEAALLHEFEHISRGDLWLRVFERYAGLFFGWHPLFIVHRRLLRLDQEILADAAAARTDPLGYAELLLQWTRQKLAKNSGIDVAWWTTSADRNLQRRIQMLIRHGATKPAPISKISTVFLVSIGILLVLLSGSMGFSASNDSPKTAEIKDSDFDPTENPTVMQDVAGTCMNKRSEPIVSAKVELWIIRRNYAVGSQAFKERETMSDQGGRFKFARVLVPTEYGSLVRCVVVRPQGYEASRVDIRAKQKHLKGFDPASLLFEFEPRDAAFSGKVIGPKGEPLVRIRVVNDYSQDPAMQVHEYQTDAEGKFRVPIVSRWFAEGRPWTVRRGVMRFVSPEFGVIATNYDHETPFTTIQFTGTGLVHGQVVDKSTGAPLANITVSSQDSSGSRDDFFCDAATTTDKLGRFTLRFPVSCLKNLFFKDPANKLLAPAMENQRIQIGKTYDLWQIEMTSGVLLSG